MGKRQPRKTLKVYVEKMCFPQNQRTVIKVAVQVGQEICITWCKVPGHNYKIFPCTATGRMQKLGSGVATLTQVLKGKGKVFPLQA